MESANVTPESDHGVRNVPNPPPGPGGGFDPQPTLGPGALPCHGRIPSPCIMFKPPEVCASCRGRAEDPPTRLAYDAMLDCASQCRAAVIQTAWRINTWRWHPSPLFQKEILLFINCPCQRTDDGSTARACTISPNSLRLHMDGSSLGRSAVRVRVEVYVIHALYHMVAFIL